MATASLGCSHKADIGAFAVAHEMCRRPLVRQTIVRSQLEGCLLCPSWLQSHLRAAVRAFSHK